MPVSRKPCLYSSPAPEKQTSDTRTAAPSITHGSSAHALETRHGRAHGDTEPAVTTVLRASFRW